LEPSVSAVERLRLLFVSNLLQPQGEGGAERIAWRELQGLAARGHAVRGLAPHWTDLACDGAEPAADPAPDVTRVPLAWRGSWRPGNEFLRARALDSAFDALLRDFRPQIVHFHNLNGISPRFVGRARRAGAATVATFHDGWGVCPKSILLRPDGSRCRGAESRACVGCLADGRRQRYSLRRRALLVSRNLRVRRALAPLERLLFPSRHHLELYVRGGFARARCRWLPNPAPDVGECPTGEAEREDAALPLRLLYLGSLRAHKGVAVLLDALAQLPAGTVRLALHGPASAREARELRETLIARRLDAWVEHGGWLMRERVPAAIGDCDALVLPSLCAENSPLSILEAMAGGRAVIASAVGGIPELVRDGATGFTFPPGDACVLAERLRGLAKAAALRRGMGERGRQDVAGRGLTAHLDALEQIYAEIARP
jgi:glycosyltransferase involved in cell wall biosynthesis